VAISKCLAAGHWLPDAVSLRSVFYEVVGQKEFTQATRIGWFSMQKSDLNFPSKTHPRLGPELAAGSFDILHDGKRDSAESARATVNIIKQIC
jgi:hypothetical protein